MKANAETVIYVPGAVDAWAVGGRSRAEAEFNYSHAILAADMRPAPYRVICQLKVDQHDCPEHMCSGAYH